MPLSPNKTSKPLSFVGKALAVFALLFVAAACSGNSYSFEDIEKDGTPRRVIYQAGDCTGTFTATLPQDNTEYIRTHSFTLKSGASCSDGGSQTKVFSGWQLQNSSNDGLHAPGTTLHFNRHDFNMYATAVWDCFRESYDLAGGSGSVEVACKTKGSTGYLLSNGKDASGSFVTKTGYYLAGWKSTTGANIALAGADPNASAAGATMPSYTAVWKPVQLTISFASDYVTAPGNIVTDYTKTIVIPSITTNYYNFSNWNITGGANAGQSVSTGSRAIHNLWQYVDYNANNATVLLGLTAQWQPKPVTITYDANGGIGSTASTNAKYGNATTLAANGFSKEGHYFDGWYKEAAATTKVDNSKTVNSINFAITNTSGVLSTTVYAKWKPAKITVQYQYNNDPNSHASVTNFTKHIPTTTTVDFGSSITLHGSTGSYAQTRCHKITQWQVSSGDSFAAGSSFTVNTLTHFSNQNPSTGAFKTANLVFTPVYTETNRLSKTITFAVNGGSLPPGINATHSQTCGKHVDVVPTKTGFTFDKWIHDSGSTIKDVAISGTRIIPYTNNAKVRAQWQPKPVTITYDANGGIGSTASTNATYGSATTLAAANGFSKEGHYFDGWYKEAAATTKVDNSKIVNSTNFAITNTTGNPLPTTVYAKWKPIPVTITYQARGSSSFTNNVPSPTTTNYATNFTAASNAEVDHCKKVTQWRSLNGGATKLVVTAGDSSPIASEAYLSRTGNAATLTLIPKTTTTLQRTITYHLDGGTGVTPTAQKTCGASFTLPTPTKTGFTFDGWQLTTPATGVVLAGTVGNQTLTAKKDATLTAKWKKISVTSMVIKKDGVGVTSIIVQKDKHITLTAEVTPANVHPPGVTWKSLAESCAKVDGTGKVTGVNPCMAEIQATSNATNAGGGKITKTVIVNVLAPKGGSGGIVVTKATGNVHNQVVRIALQANDTKGLVVRTLPAQPNANINVTNSNTSCATVNAVSVVTDSTGKASIEVIAQNHSSVAPCSTDIVFQKGSNAVTVKAFVYKNLTPSQSDDLYDHGDAKSTTNKYCFQGSGSGRKILSNGDMFVVYLEKNPSGTTHKGELEMIVLNASSQRVFLKHTLTRLTTNTKSIPFIGDILTNQLPADYWPSYTAAFCQKVGGCFQYDSSNKCFSFGSHKINFLNR